MLPIQVPEFAVGGHLEVVFEGIGHAGEEPTLGTGLLRLNTKLKEKRNNTNEITSSCKISNFT